MDDEEKGKDEEEGETAFRSDVAAQEDLLGQNQNFALMKASHRGRPVTTLAPEGVERRNEQRWQRWRQGEHIDG